LEWRCAFELDGFLSREAERLIGITAVPNLTVALIIPLGGSGRPSTSIQSASPFTERTSPGATGIERNVVVAPLPREAAISERRASVIAIPPKRIRSALRFSSTNVIRAWSSHFIGETRTSVRKTSSMVRSSSSALRPSTKVPTVRSSADTMTGWRLLLK
jgi:hypothetical protein